MAKISVDKMNENYVVVLVEDTDSINITEKDGTNLSINPKTFSSGDRLIFNDNFSIIKR